MTTQQAFIKPNNRDTTACIAEAMAVSWLSRTCYVSKALSGACPYDYRALDKTTGVQTLVDVKAIKASKGLTPYSATNIKSKRKPGIAYLGVDITTGWIGFL